MRGRVRRAVVLAAGRGSRMRRPDPSASLTPAQAAAADRGSKGLMPVRGRPFLEWTLSTLADAGVAEVCLVVPAGDRAAADHFAANPPSRVRLAYAEQAEPLGSADALAAAEAFAAGEPFLALNSDNLYPAAALAALQDLGGPGLPAFERERLLARSNFARERVDAFAVLDVDADGWLRGIVEKSPAASAPSAGPVLLSMNLWRFSPDVFEACRRVPPSSRGERELPQAVGWAVARGARLRAVEGEGEVLDLSTRADVAEVERRLEGREARP